MRKKRVLFFSHYFPPEGNAPASRVHANCKRWARSGYEVTVITCAPNVPNGVVYDGYRNRLTQTEEIDGIRVIRIWTLLAANEGVTLRILNYVSYMLSAVIRSLFVGRPDVIIATSPQFFCGWAGVLTKWLRRRPLILEIRDIWPESIVAVGAMNSRRLLRVLEWLELRMYKAADHIVAVGDGYRAQLLGKGVLDEKISVITNGVDRDLFSAVESDEDFKYQLGLGGKFVCSYVGTIGMACALDVVIRAAAILKEAGRDDVAFLLIGDGAVRPELESEAHRLGLDNVVFVGRQDKALIPRFLSISDCCLVHLRKTELFKTVLPSKIFEALAMKRPIVMGVQGHAAKIVEEARGGICIEPENERELVDAVEKLADQPELRETMSEAGYAHVIERYDRDRLASDYLHLVKGFCYPRFAPDARPKVCHVHLLSLMSGPQHSTIELFKNFPVDRYDLDVVMAPPGDEFQERLEAMGVRVQLCEHLTRSFHPIRDTRALIDLVRLFRREGYDLVHTHSSKTGGLGRLAARIARVPAVVHHVRGFAFHEFSAYLTRLGLGLIEGVIARFCDVVIFVNDEEREWAARYHIVPPDKGVTIYNGADLRDFSEEERKARRAEARADLGLLPDQAAIAFVGRLWEQKNPGALSPVLAELVRRFPSTNPVLLVAGDGPMRDDLLSAARELGVEDRVKLLGWRDDVAAIISAADVVYLPSLWEGLPRTLIEAACLGVPAVANDVKGNREVIVHGETGLLVPPNEVNAAADALGRVLSSPEILATMGKAAARRAETRYDSVETARQVETLYGALLGLDELDGARVG